MSAEDPLGDTPPELDFDVIVRETHPHIRAYIAGMGVPRHDVDDVAQDVFVELYRFFDRIPAEVHPKQWLRGFAQPLFELFPQKFSPQPPPTRGDCRDFAAGRTGRA